MPTPIVLLVGQAGAGKDTVGNSLAEIGDGRSDGVGKSLSRHVRGKTIALADPFKKLLQLITQCDTEMLWGPSEMRGNTIRFNNTNRTGIEFAIANDPEVADLCFQIGIEPSRLKNWFENEIKFESRATFRHLLQTLGTNVGRATDPDIWVNYAIKQATRELNHNPLVVVTDGRFRNEVVGFAKIGAKIVNVINPDVPVNTTDTHQSELEQTDIPSWWYDYRLYNPKDGLDKLDYRVKEMFHELFER